MVETGAIRAIGPAYAAGVRSAGAAVVAFGEDHSFPERGWAQALLEALGAGIAAVGPLCATPTLTTPRAGAP